MQLSLCQALVLLNVPADQPKGDFLLEVVDIRGAGEPNPTLPVSGLEGVSHLQISSWIRESEIPKVLSQNPHIYFCIGAV